MLHASRQWLGEVSQSSAMESRVLPQTPFSATYVGNATMRDYESEEVDDQMDEDSPPPVLADSGMHYSEEEWVRYTRGVEKTVSELRQIVVETCTQTNGQVCALEGRVDVLHATKQQSVSMCSEQGQRVQQLQRECETLQTVFQDLTGRITLSFTQVQDSFTQVESEAKTLRDTVHHTLIHAGSQAQGSGWTAENTAQLENTLQAKTTKLREDNNMGLTKLDFKVEQLSESLQGIGQTFRAHADSVHTEVLRLQTVVQSRTPSG